MSWYSGGELVASGWTSSNYAGLGILFENLPTTGENGGSPLLNDGGVAGDEVRWELISVSGLTVDEFNEDGSFISTGAGSFNYSSYVNGVSVGDFTASVQSAGGTVNSSFSSASTSSSSFVYLPGLSSAIPSISTAQSSVTYSSGLFSSFISYNESSSLLSQFIPEPVTPDLDLPISDYGHNKQWKQSIFFRQFKR